MRRVFVAGLLLLGLTLSVLLLWHAERKEVALSGGMDLRAGVGTGIGEKGPKGKRQEHPDLFAKYHREIRTRYGESAPSYPPNYRVRELLKANGLKRTQQLPRIQAATQFQWVERGPGNVSGRTRALIVDPDDPTFNTWYAGSVGGGVWKTSDAGKSWVELTRGLPNLATSTLAMAPSNHDVLYVGTGEGFGNVGQINGSGLWKTTDRGQTWEQLASTATTEFQNITRIIVDPADANVVLVATSAGFNEVGNTSGIHRSTDGGQTWTKVYDAGRHPVQHLIANPRNFNTQYATVNRVGVVKSLDGGQTWFDASEGVQGVARMEIAISGTDTSRLYLSAESINAPESILFVSEDAGQTWARARDSRGFDVDWLAGQGWYDNTIAVHPFTADVVYVGGVNLWRIDVQPGQQLVGPTVTGIDFENTDTFLTLINFSGALAGGVLTAGTVPPEDHVSIEIRFGPGKMQKAHRFTVPDGATSGVPDASYTYQDYVDVPFEVWDIDNNRQLMVSFRDQLNDGEFELRPFNTAFSREYIFPQAVPYDTVPSPDITEQAGHTFRQLHLIWPVLPDGSVWDPANLPDAILRINWGTSLQKTIDISNITDGYGQFGGSDKGVHVDHHNIVLVPIDAATGRFRLLDANDGGVSFSDDGGLTFQQPRNGYNTTQFYGVDKKNGANEFIGGMQDNSTWRSPVGEDANAASKWLQQFGGDGFEVAWHYTNPSQLLGSSQFNGIRRSLNGGITWENAGSAHGLTDTGNRAPFLTKLAKSKQDPDLIFAVGASGVWRSDNFASTWDLIGMPDGFVGNRSFSEVKISLKNPQIVWTGSHMLPDQPLFVSADGGLSFSPTNIFPDVTLGRISGLETHPTEDSTAFALFSFAHAPKILRTRDLGQTWEDISGFGADSTSSRGFPDVAVFSLLVMPFDPDIIWAGTEIGIFESKDGGASWAPANNGLPPTLIYDMLIVNDQVVVATHGRGVWSASLPELAGYQPPPATLSPRLNAARGGANGLVVMDVSLRSAYDSTLVLVEGNSAMRLPENAQPGDTTFTLVIPTQGIDSVGVSLLAFRDGQALKSSTRDVVVFPLLAARSSYSSTLDVANDDFDLVNFTFAQPPGFQNGALHSPHPYLDNSNSIAILRVPIIVAAEGAVLRYNDVALVEPGSPGVGFGNANFFDFVVVEGSNDNGGTWRPLADGYDARFDPAVWLAAFSNNQPGDASMFRTHEINLLDTFPPGEEILIRFRLFADQFVNGWGWVIDDLEIQSEVTSVAENGPLPRVFSLAQNYPNPFNPTTTIRYALPRSADVRLTIYNLLGQRIRTLVDGGNQAAGFHSVQWDGKDDRGGLMPSGIYVYRIEAGDFKKSRKMLLVK